MDIPRYHAGVFWPGRVGEPMPAMEQYDKGRWVKHSDIAPLLEPLTNSQLHRIVQTVRRYDTEPLPIPAHGSLWTEALRCELERIIRDR